MESLESKLDRLTMEQRREIEDFVDFLLSRSGPAPVLASPAAVMPPVLLAPAPAPVPGISPERVYPASFTEITGSTGDAAAGRDASGDAPYHEIDGGARDRITHDYFDYGQFDRESPPAAEAVQKVKRRIIAREDGDKPHHLLDWVD